MRGNPWYGQGKYSRKYELTSLYKTNMILSFISYLLVPTPNLLDSKKLTET